MGFVLLAVLAFVGQPAPKPNAGVQAGSCAAPALVGTWQMVRQEANGQQTPVGPSNPVQMKLLTATHFVVFLQDPAKKGAVAWMHGGPYVLTGDTYQESIAYGFGDGFNAVGGQNVSFKCWTEGEKWIISGKLPDGTALTETWERAK